MDDSPSGSGEPNELEKYISSLIHKFKAYKECHNIRIKHTIECIDKEIWDEGHGNIIYQSRRIYGECRSILEKILSYLKSKKIHYFLQNEIQEIISEKDLQFPETDEYVRKSESTKNELIRKIDLILYEKRKIIGNGLEYAKHLFADWDELKDIFGSPMPSFSSIQKYSFHSPFSYFLSKGKDNFCLCLLQEIESILRDSFIPLNLNDNLMRIVYKYIFERI